MAQVTRASAQSDANTVEIETTAGANTAARVGGVIGDIADSAAWCGTGAVAYRLTYSTAGNENAWSTTAWSDGTFIGVAAAYSSLPTTGAFRLGQGEVVMVKDADGNDSPLMLAAGGPGSTRLYLGYTTGIYNIQYRCVTSHLFDIGSTTVAAIGNGFIAIGNDGSDPSTGLLRINSDTADSSVLRLSDYFGTSVSLIECGHSGSDPTLEFGYNTALTIYHGFDVTVQMDSTGTYTLRDHLSEVLWTSDETNGHDANEYPLRGFYSDLSALDGSDDVAVPNDSSPYTIGSYQFSGSAGQVLYIEFVAYLSSGTSSASKFAYKGRVLVQYGAPSAISNSLITYIGGTPLPGLTIAVAISGNDTLQVQATSTITAFFGAAVEFWDQKARTITTS